MSKELIPLVGFDKVRFGMKEDEVVKLLGKPSERTVSKLGDEEGEDAVDMEYHELGLSLSFDGLENFRLTDIMTDGMTDYKLSGRICVGMTFDETMNAASELDLGPREEVDLEDDLDGEPNDENLVAYELPEVGVTLWFKDGILDTIQMAPEYDDRDNIVWPKA